MPDLLNRRKFKDDEVVVAIQSMFVDGVADVVRQGTRLRGDHPAVRKIPPMFIRDGATGEELRIDSLSGL